MPTEMEPPPADGESRVLADPLIVRDQEPILAAIVIGLIAIFAA